MKNSAIIGAHRNRLSLENIDNLHIVILFESCDAPTQLAFGVVDDFVDELFRDNVRSRFEHVEQRDVADLIIPCHGSRDDQRASSSGARML